MDARDEEAKDKKRKKKKEEEDEKEAEATGIEYPDEKGEVKWLRTRWR